MNIHTKLVGAIDAVVLSLTAALNVAMLLALLGPIAPADREDPAQFSVTIEQLPT